MTLKKKAKVVEGMVGKDEAQQWLFEVVPDFMIHEKETPTMLTDLLSMVGEVKELNDSHVALIRRYNDVTYAWQSLCTDHEYMKRWREFEQGERSILDRLIKDIVEVCVKKNTKLSEELRGMIDRCTDEMAENRAG